MIHDFYVIWKLYIYYLLLEDRGKDMVKSSDYVSFPCSSASQLTFYVFMLQDYKTSQLDLAKDSFALEKVSRNP
jgi:hypothetical protein